MKLNITKRDITFFITGIMSVLAILFIFNRNNKQDNQNGSQEKKDDLRF